MEPITTSKTTTKINTQQIYPQPKNNRKSQIVAESSSNSGGTNGSEGVNGDTEGLEENEVLAESEDTDPFLLVSLRDSKNSRKPKNISYLYMNALLDFSIVTVCTILLVHRNNKGQWHWRNAAWDWVALGLIRFIIVVGIASSRWIRELYLILAGVVCFSSLYIIFKFNLIFQRKSIDKYYLILLISSFIFCQIHWITYTAITTDNRRRARFLGNQSIYFEEESRSIHRNISSPSTLQSYGSTVNRDDEIGVLNSSNN